MLPFSGECLRNQRHRVLSCQRSHSHQVANGNVGSREGSLGAAVFHLPLPLLPAES